ncbi:unnamed protein product [Adineta steineri]|uniref:Uncharacterized protein n=1 Tax=Adineta steineri TaxID=433720 RepID=A0A814H306_9BILA|nr:unnamed protein product [Adineta steineri]CAF1391559.1 unnamed protein product [Adineta steineri]CAF1392936.1 unnamed protein product [Adineta steineri]
MRDSIHYLIRSPIRGIKHQLASFNIGFIDKSLSAKGQHDVVITKDASVDLIYLGARLRHYDCLLEGEVSLSNLLYKNSNHDIREIIGQVLFNSLSVLNQCQGDELTTVYSSILI